MSFILLLRRVSSLRATHGYGEHGDVFSFIKNAPRTPYAKFLLSPRTQVTLYAPLVYIDRGTMDGRHRDGVNKSYTMDAVLSALHVPAQPSKNVYFILVRIPYARCSNGQ